MLYCTHCQALAAVTEEKPKLCATCGSPVEWRETGDGAFTINHNDRTFLRKIGVAVDEHEVKS